MQMSTSVHRCSSIGCSGRARLYPCKCPHLFTGVHLQAVLEEQDCTHANVHICSQVFIYRLFWKSKTVPMQMSTSVHRCSSTGCSGRARLYPCKCPHLFTGVHLQAVLEEQDCTHANVHICSQVFIYRLFWKSKTVPMQMSTSVHRCSSIGCSGRARLYPCKCPHLFTGVHLQAVLEEQDCTHANVHICSQVFIYRLFWKSKTVPMQMSTSVHRCSSTGCSGRARLYPCKCPHLFTGVHLQAVLEEQDCTHANVHICSQVFIYRLFWKSKTVPMQMSTSVHRCSSTGCSGRARLYPCKCPHLFTGVHLQAVLEEQDCTHANVHICSQVFIYRLFWKSKTVPMQMSTSVHRCSSTGCSGRARLYPCKCPHLFTGVHLQAVLEEQDCTHANVHICSQVFIYRLFWKSKTVPMQMSTSVHRCSSTGCSGRARLYPCKCPHLFTGVHLQAVLEEQDCTHANVHICSQVFIYRLFWKSKTVPMQMSTSVHRCSSTGCSGRARTCHAESRWKKSRKRFRHTRRAAFASD